MATNVTVSAPQHAWVTVPQSLSSLGVGDMAPLSVTVVPPAGTPAGVYTENLLVSAGNDTPNGHLSLTIAVATDGSTTVRGSYTQDDVPASVATIETDVPVNVYAANKPAPPVLVGKVGGVTGTTQPSPDICEDESGSGSAASSTNNNTNDLFGLIITIIDASNICHGTGSDDFGIAIGSGQLPSIQAPPPPVATAHEVVKLEIPQTISLERQAFVAALSTTDTSGSSLDNFSVIINVIDKNGSETNLQGQR